MLCWKNHLFASFLLDQPCHVIVILLVTVIEYEASLRMVYVRVGLWITHSVTTDAVSHSGQYCQLVVVKLNSQSCK